MHLISPPGVPAWILPILFPIEVLGLFIKPFALTLRLFANMTAGHIILLTIISLIFVFESVFVSFISIPFGTFMFLLKILVSFLQAYVFTLLSSIYFGKAIEESH
jgi:F-type H+-transporting ATPase subunit a